MSLGDISADALILGLRFALLLLLYGFLVAVFLVVLRELRAQGRSTAVTPPGHLLVVEPGASALAPGQRIPLQPLTTLGRAPSNTLVVDDTFVSALHAALSWHDGRWWLRDEGSTNGSLVNGEAVAGSERALAFGDVVGIGAVRLKLSR